MKNKLEIFHYIKLCEIPGILNDRDKYKKVSQNFLHGHSKTNNYISLKILSSKKKDYLFLPREFLSD